MKINKSIIQHHQILVNLIAGTASGKTTGKPANVSLFEIAGGPWRVQVPSLKKPYLGIPAWQYAITIGVLAVLPVVAATAGEFDVTQPNNVLAGLAATPANVAVNSMHGGPVSALTDNRAFDGAQDGPFTFADAPAEEILAITGFNSAFNTVRIYTAQDPSRQLGDLTLKASATRKTSLQAADYELDLGTFPANTRTYTDYINGGRVYYDLPVKAPAGTKSLFLATKKQANGGRIYEIQALDGKPNEVMSGASTAAEVIPVLLGPPIRHDQDGKLVTMVDAQGNLLLRLNYDGRCMLDQVVVRGRQVVSAATGAYSSLRLGTAEASTRKLEASPQVVVSGNTVTASGIRFGAGDVRVEETWTFTVLPESIVWRIARKYLNAGTLDDTCFPGFDFTNHQTWTGALLGTGGVAWFKLFDTPVATYLVHTGPATFWNKTNGACLRIVPSVPAGRHVAMRFSRNPQGVLSFNYYVTAHELGLTQGQYRFSRERHDVAAPFQVVAGETAVEYDLSGLDYAKAYDRGVFQGIDGAAVREICNTIARLGAIDKNIHGSNGWYSGYAVLHEHWIAQLGLAIDDPYYFQSYAETLDYQRDHAIGSDGRVKSRWAYGPFDAVVPGTYDALGFYECGHGCLMDSQPSYVTNVAEEFDFTGDLEWVRRHKATCERALDFSLRRDSNGNGLVEMMTDSHRTDGKASDWIDCVPASFENGLVNAEMYNAMLLWADVETELGDSAMASKYRACAKKLKEGFNRSTAEGGLWDAERQCYAYWRDKDGSVQGRNMVTPVNFMAVAYGICDDPLRRAAILGGIEAQMQREKLFMWPLCMSSFATDEGGGAPFPNYENGDIFLGWGELGIRAYANLHPDIAVRCVKNVLDQYAKDGLAFQRYLRKSQTGDGADILSNMANPIVGLYRDIYGIQPKWNRLYLEPHLTRELDGTRLKYWLRNQQYLIALATPGCTMTVNGFTVMGKTPFAVNSRDNAVEYFHGPGRTPAMSVTRSGTAPMELCIETWPDTGNGARKWTETCGNGDASARHVVYGLVPNSEYNLAGSGAAADSIKSDAGGSVTFEVRLNKSQPQVLELKGPY